MIKNTFNSPIKPRQPLIPLHMHKSASSSKKTQKSRSYDRTSTKVRIKSQLENLPPYWTHVQDQYEILNIIG